MGRSNPLKRKQNASAGKKPVRRNNDTANLIGRSIRLLGIDKDLPKLKPSAGMKPAFLSRVLEPDATLKSDSTFNRIYRDAVPKNDELMSTALTREGVKGIFEKNGQANVKPEEVEYYTELIDLASGIRIPTAFSGFATKGGKLQHPTNPAQAIFADPKGTGRLHSKMDAARRYYVESKMTKSIAANKNATGVMKAGLLAAIEFTLNYFTAPATAKNVLPYSKYAGQPLTNKTLLAQVEAREKMKQRYVELGGKLRRLKSTEDLRESLERIWETEMSPQKRVQMLEQLEGPFAGDVNVPPPSPLRNPGILPDESQLVQEQGNDDNSGESGEMNEPEESAGEDEMSEDEESDTAAEEEAMFA